MLVVTFCTPKTKVSSMKTIKAVYKSSDGETFDTEEKCLAHEELVTVARNLEDAVRAVEQAMGKTALTADGVSFGNRDSSSYWIIRHWFGGGLPCLEEVSIYRYWARVVADRKELWVRDDQRGKPQEYRIADLYADRKKARAACKKLCLEYMEEFKTKIAKLDDDQ